MKRRSGFQVMTKLVGLVRPLTGFMVLAILMGLIGQLCASFLTILAGYGVLWLLKHQISFSLPVIFGSMILLALLRGFFRYAEQSCNHYIAFRLLALLREKVFAALRKLCPAKLAGKDKGDLIALITSDIELLEVFYAHTISPIFIAVLFTLAMCGLIGSYHIDLGFLALLAYSTVGIVLPLLISKSSKDMVFCGY